MSPFIAFDTEDDSMELLAGGGDGRNKKVTQIAAVGTNGERFHNRGDNEEFIRWLCKQGEEVTCYSHNMGYDLGNLFRHNLDAFNIRTMVGSRMISATYKNVTFLDSFNLFPMSLKKVGDAFDLPKLEYPTQVPTIREDYRKGKFGKKEMLARLAADAVNKSRYMAENQEYVFRDAEIVRKAIQFAQRFAEDNGVPGLPSTLGGLCLRLWKAMGGENFQCTDDFARQAYYGGRVELFHVGGKGRIFYTDINSLYPFAMTMPFPNGWADLPDLEGFGVADITMDLPRQFIAPLPVRREDGSVYYPHGRVRPTATLEARARGRQHGAWTLHEIRDALKHGGKLVQIHRVMGSKSASYPYRGFVEKFYEQRRVEKNKAVNLMLKLCLNNLYGKLGASGTVTKSRKLKPKDFTEDGFYHGGGKPYGSNQLVDVQMPLDENTNYLHAAYVTGYGRLELMKYLRQIGAGELIYCDTDSVIFFGKEKELPFPISDRLGGMKLEGTAWQCLTHAPKVYQFGKDYKAKGVRRDLARQFIEKGEVSFDQPWKFREAAAFYDGKLNADGTMQYAPNSKPLSCWREVTKRRVSEYDRKVKGKNGIYWPKKHSESED